MRRPAPAPTPALASPPASGPVLAPPPCRALTLAFALALALAAVPAAAQVVVRATLEPQLIGLGETATFVLEVQSRGLTGVRFDPTFTLENLDIVAGPARSEDVTLANGSLTRTFRQTWLVRPRAAGPARVRGIALKLLDRAMPLPDHEIQVQPQPTGAAPAAPAGTGPGAGAEPSSPWGGLAGRGGWPDPEEIFERLFGGGPLRPSRSPAAPVFLRNELQPTRPLVGEQILYTLYVYTRQDLAAVSEKDQPTFRGFWVRDIALPEHLPTELTVVDGVRYTRVPLARKALFALRPGHHPLEAASADVVVETYDPGFFAPPVPRSQQLHLATPPCAVEVQPLPPAPPGFAGAVGQLRLAAQVAPGSLPLGGATTVTVRLAGAGNLQGVAPPRLEAPAELTVSPPEQQSLDHLAGTTVEGERTWTYAVVPRSPGSFPLRVSALPYFDPVKREYRLAMAPPLTVVALPTAAAGRGAGAPPAAGQVTAADGPGGASGSSLGEPWRARADALRQAWATVGWPGRAAWGLGLSLAGALALLLTALSRRRLPGSPGFPGSPGLPGSPRSPRSPGPPGAAATEGVRQLERRLAEAATATRPRRVAVEVEEGWRDFLAARGELPPGAPSARWPDLVRARRWPREAADDLARLTADIAYLRQAPQLSATEELRGEIVARSRKLLRKLR